MDSKWTWRDWVFLFVLLVLGGLICLQIWQNDRQYERLRELTRDFHGFRRLVTEGGIIAQPPTGDNTTTTGDNATQARYQVDRVRPDHPTGDWQVRHMIEPASTLNLITSKDAYGSAVQGYIFDSLLQRNPNTFAHEPLLAVALPEISADKKVFTFKLRKGVRWHDGEAFDADDILFSYRMIKDPKVDCANLRNYYRDLVKVEALDKYTVRFTAKTVYWRWISTLGGMPIVPEHVYRDKTPSEFNTYKAREPIGTGPYRFVRWDDGQQIVLERNREYWNRNQAPYVDRIVFKFVKDPTAAMEHVKKREIDRYGPTQEQWYKDALEDAVIKRYDRRTVPNRSFSYIGWNQRRELFKDKRVRRAMTHAFPRETFLKTRMKGLGVVVTGNFYYKSPAYDKSITPYAYDHEKSKQLLAEAGWVDTNGNGIRDRNGKEFEFQLMTASGRSVRRQMAITMKTELAKIGVKMDIREMDWSAFLEKIDNRDFDAVILGWSLGLDPDPFQLWHSSMTGPSGSNFCGFKVKRADEIIEACRVEFDENKRNAMFHEFHKILHDEQPYTFCFNSFGLLLVHKRFRDVKVYPLGLQDSEWWVPPADQKYGRVD